MNVSPSAVREDKYHVEKATFGGISQITLHGTLNEEFEGRKLATSIKSKKILLDLRDVRRFASWGMSEWMEFLRINEDADIYLIECSTYAVSQLNIVTGLLGHAKLVSFYASFRCTSCSEELQTRFLIPKDRLTLHDAPSSRQTCPTCGGAAKLEAYPAAFFETIASRPPFDIDDEVLAYMRGTLKYELSPDLTQFRAYRRSHKDYTYIRLSGHIGKLPAEQVARAAEGTTVVDLESVLYEPGFEGGWRDLLPRVLPRVRSLQLVGCPPGFLETALHPEDLREKIKVRTFAAGYVCGTCGARTSMMIDVAANLEDLVQGVIQPLRCPSCRASVNAALTPELLRMVTSLPARDRDMSLDGFLSKVRNEPSDKLENVLSLKQPKLPSAPKPQRSGLLVGMALSAVVLGAAAVVATRLWSQPVEVTKPTTVAPVVTPAKPQFTRPDWIFTNVPASGYCQDAINRVICVGVSSYADTKENGVAEATDTALEELVSTIGLKITDPFFHDTLVPAYNDERGKALSALQAAELARTRDANAAAAYRTADEAVHKARKRVVDLLRASGGGGVPAQRSDWYWEEYNRENGPGTEFLVFVRFDVSIDAMRSLVERYSTTTPVLGSGTMTAFPELAWQSAHFDGGVLVVKPAGALAAAGVAPQTIVTTVGDTKIVDAPSLAKAVDAAAAGTDIKMTVHRRDEADRVIAVKR